MSLAASLSVAPAPAPVAGSSAFASGAPAADAEGGADKTAFAGLLNGVVAQTPADPRPGFLKPAPKAAGLAANDADAAIVAPVGLPADTPVALVKDAVETALVAEGQTSDAPAEVDAAPADAKADAPSPPVAIPALTIAAPAPPVAATPAAAAPAPTGAAQAPQAQAPQAPAPEQAAPVVANDVAIDPKATTPVAAQGATPDIAPAIAAPAPVEASAKAAAAAALTIPADVIAPDAKEPAAPAPPALKDSTSAATRSGETAAPPASPASTHTGDPSTATAAPVPARSQTADVSTTPAPAEKAAEPTAADMDAPADAAEPLRSDAPANAAPAAAREAAQPQTTPAALASTLSRATVETTAHLSAQILRRLEGRSTHFDMVLTPDALGRVEVSVDIDSDGQLAARLAFDNPAAATEMRGRADELRRQLEDAGFRVSDDSLNFTDRDSGRSGDQRQDGAARRFASAARVGADADAVASPVRWMSMNLTPDRVDVRV
ncbi:flagellar hook-length control protein FliK [Brevundimonas sp. Leaf363]|uniref:flagellar hook-length control protein FliK n=1 Tax=Brevundimonas sp. Leaf363 TaxID=1736353 RepID=UPI000AD6307E|nr:flagellar hook-length control protein FliK [Brevundimonas sp. Leaf363]